MPLVMFACNDHRNGEFKGTFTNCVVYLGKDIDDALELESEFVDRGLKMAYEMGDGGENGKFFRVRLGKDTRFEASRYVQWHGTWVWDSVRMSWPETARLLNFLRKKKFSCHCGPTKLFDRFNDRDGADFTEAELRAVLGEGA
jgi:hypothetical protein